MFVSAPESAAVESKISSGVVVFVRDFPPYQTRDVLRIFQPDLCSHETSVCPDL